MYTQTRRYLDFLACMNSIRQSDCPTKLVPWLATEIRCRSTKTLQLEMAFSISNKALDSLSPKYSCTQQWRCPFLDLMLFPTNAARCTNLKLFFFLMNLLPASRELDLAISRTPENTSPKLISETARLHSNLTDTIPSIYPIMCFTQDIYFLRCRHWNSQRRISVPCPALRTQRCPSPLGCIHSTLLSPHEEDSLCPACLHDLRNQCRAAKEAGFVAWVLERGTEGDAGEAGGEEQECYSGMK